MPGYSNPALLGYDFCERDGEYYSTGHRNSTRSRAVFLCRETTPHVKRREVE